MDKSKDNEILTGGNVNEGIEKVGDIIYRQQRNSYLHEFYKYMEEMNFEGVSRFFGVDKMNREKLSFIPGYVPGNSYPNCASYIWSDDNLMKVAKFMKDYHDMSTGFIKQAHHLSWSSPLFKQDKCEVICHNDAAPYNFVYQNEKFVGLIDFDEAYPGTRIWDLAYILYTNIPLASFQPNLDKTTRDYLKSDAIIRKKRIKLFFSNYGQDHTKELFNVLIKRLEALCDLIKYEAMNGNSAFKKMYDQGEVEYYLDEIQFIRSNWKDWI